MRKEGRKKVTCGVKEVTDERKGGREVGRKEGGKGGRKEVTCEE